MTHDRDAEYVASDIAYSLVFGVANACLICYIVVLYMTYVVDSRMGMTTKGCRCIHGIRGGYLFVTKSTILRPATHFAV